MPENKHLRRFLYCIYAGLAILVLWLLLRFALPWLMPFIVAYLIARLIRPAVCFMCTRLRFKRGAAAAIGTVVVFALLITVLGLLIRQAVISLTAFAKDLPALLSDISELFSGIGSNIDRYISQAPAEMRAFLQGAIDSLAVKSMDLPADISGKILGFLSNAASATPKTVIFIFTSAISVFFISHGYDDVNDFIMRQIPERRHKALREFKSDLFTTFGKWVRAELMLSGIAFIELTIAFLIMRVDFAVLLALIIAIIDVLPVLGVGIVLVPWALISLIAGNYVTAIMLAVTYGVIELVHSIMEPKLVGRQIGLPPIAALMAMYIGFKTVGIIGMAAFPIGLIMLKQANDKGYLKLWR